ncbi:MAG: hypothetical protein A3K10_06900 [Bacteroidetes bacterium RIFCSPLOWO2_12_FULL_31_6]|nr:MAG: hypothetical protein A3K10_06900 [Bacteroidetes bacterium RIFCSPLOWO2_12_FULL_31_6]
MQTSINISSVFLKRLVYCFSFFIQITVSIQLCAQQNLSNNTIKSSAQNLQAMLEGNKKLSIKDAYYIMESAWDNCYLSQGEYNNIIHNSGNFIKKWLIENKLDTTSNIALNYGICKFFNDTLYLKNNQVHIPLGYDYVDFKAQEDYRNTFVTKALATGWGQCNTLPAIYVILAEEINAKAWISYAPYHSFIKFLDDNGTMQNYDPASHMHITDQLYQDYLFISSDAEKNRIYLDTLSKIQTVSSCLIDLSYMYLLKTNFSDLQTAETWIDYSLNFFHNKEANLQAWFIKSNIIVNKLNHEMRQYGITDIKKVSEVKELKPLYDKYVEAENKIKELGYRDIPQEQYSLMMKHYKEKEKEQINKGVDGKQKKELLIEKN